MSPLWLELLKPYILLQPIGRDKVPIFFWSAWGGRGGEFVFHSPWSRWVPGSRSKKICAINFWKLGCSHGMGIVSDWIMPMQKKIILRWIGVFYWQVPFNGCLNRLLCNFQFCLRYQFQMLPFQYFIQYPWTRLIFRKIIRSWSIHRPDLLQIPFQYLILDQAIWNSRTEINPHPGQWSHYPCILLIHRIASKSLIFPKYIWVVAKFECRNRIFDTISSGVPDRDA